MFKTSEGALVILYFYAIVDDFNAFKILIFKKITNSLN
jgi:hypothetical protein